jgi:hypothetical protein
MLRIVAAHLNICRTCQTKFRKVQRTEISFVKFTVLCTFENLLIDFSTNIEVRCTNCVTSVIHSKTLYYGSRIG